MSGVVITRSWPERTVGSPTTEAPTLANDADSSARQPGPQPAPTDSLDWLALVPAEAMPDGYEDAVRAEHLASERIDDVAAKVNGLQSKLNGAVAKAAMPFSRLSQMAMELNAARTVLGAMPPVSRVPDEAHKAMLNSLAARLPLITLGAPPAYAAEVVHHVFSHSKERPPLGSDDDLRAVELFEDLVRASVKLHQQSQLLRSGLADPHAPLTTPVSHVVRAMVAQEQELLRHAQVVRAARELIDAVDGQRVSYGRSHRCRLWAGGRPVFEPIPFGSAWTLEWALAGNGRPPIPAAS